MEKNAHTVPTPHKWDKGRKLMMNSLLKPTQWTAQYFCYLINIEVGKIP